MFSDTALAAWLTQVQGKEKLNPSFTLKYAKREFVLKINSLELTSLSPEMSGGEVY